eukprot:Amastigsp_a681091_3.p2 type:complete len:163 gc:universal Amastigsp_a681091_3:11-499(+)
MRDAERRKENMKRILEIQANLTKCDVKKNLASRDRLFVREGTMMKVSKGKMQERTFYLFSDMLLYGESKKAHSITFKGMIPMDKLVVVAPGTAAELGPNELRLVNLVKRKTIDMHCNDAAESKSWLSDLARLVRKARPGPLDAESQAFVDKLVGAPNAEYQE